MNEPYAVLGVILVLFVGALVLFWLGYFLLSFLVLFIPVLMIVQVMSSWPT